MPATFRNIIFFCCYIFQKLHLNTLEGLLFGTVADKNDQSLWLLCPWMFQALQTVKKHWVSWGKILLFPRREKKINKTQQTLQAILWKVTFNRVVFVDRFYSWGTLKTSVRHLIYTQTCSKREITNLLDASPCSFLQVRADRREMMINQWIHLQRLIMAPNRRQRNQVP